MPAADRLDRLLDRPLADLAERLAASGDDRILVRPDDVGPGGRESVEALCGLDLLVPSEPARTVICDGCDQGCTMEVRHAAGNDRVPSRAFVACDKRGDIGRVPVDPSRLRQWQLPLERVAVLASRLLGTDRDPRPGAVPLTWDLGTAPHGKDGIEIRLTPVATDGAAFHGLTVALSIPPDAAAGAMIGLRSLLRFRDRQPRLDRAALRRALNARFGDSRTAWEIGLEGGDIILINHATGETKVVASPNFDSSNDNAFQTLYANPGRKFSLRELQIEARDTSIGDLHKMVENLKFQGNLKKVFFRVSRNAIRFDRTASLGRLSSLGIDPTNRS